ncbi:MAG: Ldh family oxidoreductase [Chloroflexota bacterium]
MKISVEDLRQTTLKALLYYGYSQSEAPIIMNVLMYAQLRGNNQGVVKLIGAGLPKDPQAGAITVRKETPISTSLDGAHNLGILAMKQATKIAVEKARTHGIGIVGTHNTNSSTGAIGYYATQIAAEGFVAIVASGSFEIVAMYGSYEPLFGTNPIAFGIPTKGLPLVFDMATSAIARYGIIEAQMAGRPIPENVAYDNTGQPTTDPVAALQGATRAFGGYKGAALALMIELLTHQFVGTSVDATGRKVDWGNLILALDPALLVEPDEFYTDVTTFLERVKNVLRLPNVDEITLPGERGNRILQEALKTGEIEIEMNLWRELQNVAERYKE